VGGAAQVSLTHRVAALMRDGRTVWRFGSLPLWM
jgi:hypothetical protein